MERSAIHLLSKRGKSQREIARELGYSRVTVARVLTDPPARPPTRRRASTPTLSGSPWSARPQPSLHLGERGSHNAKAEYRRLLANLDAASPVAVILPNEKGLKAPRDILVSELYRGF